MKVEFKDLPCDKLGSIAHVKVGYYFGKYNKFLAGFECKKVSDCGICRSTFSGTLNYTVDCPIYVALAKSLK